MAIDRLVEPIVRAAALDAVGDRLRSVIRKAQSPRARRLLSGELTGHPLHPVLTDVPIGFWTSAWVLDLFGGKRARRTADAMLALGLAAAVPTVVTGWSDWAEGGPQARRVGLVHAASMGTTTVLYAAALGARRRPNRRKRFWLAQAAAATATAGAYLGGHLVYRAGMGVDKTVD